MNGREIIYKNLQHQQPTRAGFTYTDGRLNDMLIVGIGQTTNWTPKRWIEDGKEFYNDEWGNIWWREPNGCVKGEIFEPFLTSWDKLKDLTVPDYSQDELYTYMKQCFQHEEKKFKLAHIGGWVFDNARYLRKMEQYFIDFYDALDEVHELNRMIAKVYETKIRKAAECGADGIFIGEDLGTQRGLLMSPDMFREFFLGYYNQLVGLAHELGMKVFLHSCGNNWTILEDLCKSGIDCFQFDQPAVYDMEALAELFRKYKVALWAPVDIQKILPTGDRDYIESECDKLVSIFGSGLILKNYPDLPGIGVKSEWDMWAYRRFLKVNNVEE